MTAPDLPTRLLAAITEDEQRDAHDRDCLLTDNPDDGWCDRGCCARTQQRCAALREIVERHSHPRCAVLPNRATSHRCSVCGWPMPCPDLRSLARAYGLNPEENTNA